MRSRRRQESAWPQWPNTARRPGSTFATSPAAQRTYTVAPGDSLGKISEKLYGDWSQWKRIFEANRDQISNPDLIHPGQTFIIPD